MAAEARRAQVDAELTLVGTRLSQGVLIRDDATQLGVLLGLCKLDADRIDSAAGDPALDVLEQQGCLTELGVGRLVELADSDVGRNRVEATRVDNLRSGLLCHLVVIRDGVVDEQHLATQVDVVSTGLGALGHQGATVLRIRPHNGQHHLCTGRKLSHRRLVGSIRNNDRPVRYACVLRDVGKLLSVPACQRHLRLTGVFSQIVHNQTAHETRGTVDDDVVLAVVIATLWLCGRSSHAYETNKTKAIPRAN